MSAEQREESMTEAIAVQEFAGNVSSGLHEVKQPLAALQITLELALLPGHSADSQTKYLENALSLLERLSGSVGLLAEIVALYKVPAPASNWCLNELLPAALESVELCFRDRNLSVRTSLKSEQQLYVSADKGRLERLLSILFRHVAESAPEGSELEVRCSETDSNVVLSIVEISSIPGNRSPSTPAKMTLPQLLLFSLANVLGAEFQQQMNPFNARIVFA